MIDWLSASIPLTWDVPINAGQVIHVRGDGTVERITEKTLHLGGSYSSSLALRTVQLGRIEVSGNIVKWLQGHNLFGTDDLRGLVYGAMEKICHILQINPTDEDKQSWIKGDFTISRIDVTEMYELPTASDVQAWLKAASEAANIKWRGRGHFQDGTLYFGKVAKGKRASWWQLKLYHKGSEIGVRGHELPENLPCREELTTWAANKLRIELTLRSRELSRKGVQTGDAWIDGTPERLHRLYADRMQIGEAVMCDDTDLENLPKEYTRALSLWKDGHDVRRMYSKSSFYRYRSKILQATGVDISTQRPKSNVIPLRRVLEAKPAVLPDWAQNTMYQPVRLRTVA
jgi:II/X family phage/plasmid replication protein